MDTERGFRIFSGLYSHLPKAAPNKKEFLSFYIFLLDQGPIAPLCTEAASGYFEDEWRWEKARVNAGFIVLFGSTDDPFLPWSEQETVATSLKAELHKYEDRGHFMDSSLPEIVTLIKQKLQAVK